MAERKKGKTKKTSEKRGQAQGFPLLDEIILWLVLALSLLILISNMGFGGFIGNAVSHFCLGIFGFPAYVLPVALFFMTAFFISNRKNRIIWFKVAGMILFWICFCTFAELLNGFDAENSFLDYYKNSIEYHSGGGIFGGLICSLLCPAFGVAGAYVVLAVCVIIAVILITERSLFEGVRRGSSKVYESAKRDARRRKEQAKLRREENEIRRERELLEERSRVMHERNLLEETKRRRIENKVSGVSFDTLLDGKTEQAPEAVPEEKETEPAEDFVISRGEEFVEPEEDYVEMEVSFLEEGAKKEDFAARTEEGCSEEGKQEALKEQHSGKNARSSKKEQQAGMEKIAKEIEQREQVKKPEYVFPPLSLLQKSARGCSGDSNKVLRNTAQKLQNTLDSFGVKVHITNVSCGPSVTRYELTPEQGVKVSRIVNLADDIKLNLAAADIRIEAPIPGKAAVGIEVPNQENSVVHLRELLESKEFKANASKLTFAVGKDLAGKAVVADIAKMPHLLIAGATGSGKSVCINTIIMSLIYKANPEEVKLIMIDPKVVELSVYNGIPHLFIPVVTDAKKAAGALNWAVAEMNDRYQKFAEVNVRDLASYNRKIESVADIEDENKPKKLPQIVIIVDELADLMMVAPGEVEDAICRLAQLARAAGLHLIIATQRPSVNVITGLIKANMPSRIAFAVSSGVDSRTIIDMNGAEKLLGGGDMLFYPQGYQRPARIQGALVTDKEIADVVNFLTKGNDTAEYSQEMEQQMSRVRQAAAELRSGSSDVDEYFADAGKFIIEKDKASIGMLQRMFKIGFNRAARIMDQLSEAGVVGPDEGTKPRKVLMSMEQFENYLEG